MRLFCERDCVFGLSIAYICLWQDKLTLLENDSYIRLSHLNEHIWDSLFFV